MPWPVQHADPLSLGALLISLSFRLRIFLDWHVASAEPERDNQPEASTEQNQTQPPTGPRFRWPRFKWPLLVVLLGAALLGLALGAGVVLRGRSLGPTAAGGTATRPTFVIGQSVSPSPSQLPSPQVAASPSPTTSEYVIQPGDTLRSIAQDVYGDANQWPRIYDANRELIGDDPDALQTGTRLRIP
jgi:nucleoid-associated protein YgaU